jgi:hypothetical protein
MADKNEKNDIRFIKGSNEKLITATELRNEISQCLQIENLNFLIGAGCSSFMVDEAGNKAEKSIPTMAYLAKEFYEKKPDFKFDGRNYAKDDERFNTNLETLINHLMSILNITKERNRPSVTNKIKCINEFIFNKVCGTVLYPELLQLYRDFYIRIVRKTRQVPINIYTTNYDLYNEQALDSLSFMYNNGFLGSAQRVFNPNSYNYIVVENLNLSRDSWKSVSNFINLFKIHGSINWIKETNGATGTTYIIEKDIELIRNRKRFDSLMIYPTPQKDRTTLMMPYSDLFRIMQNNLLKQNSVLITMGYSFSDEHINRIILNALSVYDFRIVIFGKSKMIDCLKEIGDNRIWIINSTDKLEAKELPIQYFKSIVEKALPALDDEQQENRKIHESLIRLTTVLSEGGKNE